MKKTIAIVLLAFGLNQPASSLCIGSCGGKGLATEVTQLLNLAELLVQTLTIIEKLENVRDLGEVLDVIDLEELRAIKEYAPLEFQVLLTELEAVQGANFDRIMEIFEETELVFALDEQLDTMYLRRLEDAASQAGFAEKAYNGAAQSQELIYAARDQVSGLEKQIDRDVAGSVITAETAAGIQKIIQLQAVQANTQAQIAVEDTKLQQKHMEAAEHECSTDLCSEMKALVEGTE